MQGNMDEALAILTEALSHTERTGERWCEADLDKIPEKIVWRPHQCASKLAVRALPAGHSLI